MVENNLKSILNHRYFIQLSYKGTHYHGWQIQPNAKSVQEIINNALTTLFRYEIKTTGAGRTDTGVHARMFVAHFDFAETLDKSKDKILRSLNAILPEDIAVTDLYEVIPDAHARFSAIERTYEYTLLQRKDPFQVELGWFYPYNLNMEQMNKAGELLLNYSDFTCFSKLHSDVKTNICNLVHARWTNEPDKLIFRITADRFLRNMVRAIVGTMIDVGRGRNNLENVKMIIESKNRRNAGVSVPACGLVLTNIKYPVDIMLI